MKDEHLYSGLIRLHILQQAARNPVFGMGIIEELGGRGFRLSAGTLYPLLHGLEREGYLRSTRHRAGSRYRRLYRVTPQGRRAVSLARVRLRELFGDLVKAPL